MKSCAKEGEILATFQFAVDRCQVLNEQHWKNTEGKWIALSRTLQTWGEFLLSSGDQRCRPEESSSSVHTTNVCDGVWVLFVYFCINTFTHCCLYCCRCRINRMPAFWRETDRKSNLVTCIKNGIVTWLQVVCSNLLASGPWLWMRGSSFTHSLLSLFSVLTFLARPSIAVGYTHYRDP